MSFAFSTLRRQILEEEYAHLNDRQREAVFAYGSPLLILAGAGSGKTTAVVGKIGYLMTYGNTYQTEREGTPDDVSFLQDCLQDKSLRKTDRYFDLMRENPINAYHLLAITFTNKAAGEMRERIEKYYHVAAEDLWALTFHSLCVRILRKYINLLGFDNSFTIYDDSDSTRLLEHIIKDMNLDERYKPKVCKGFISRAKTAQISPEEYPKRVRDAMFSKMGTVYEKYQAQLKEANALDFDDLIYYTVTLLEKFEDVRARIQKRFRYVLVDEYQDTNPLQYRLVSLLVSDGNICVVGDDDQSIYRFMGADIDNILSFERQFDNARVIRLEQNYRSTQVILDAANAVIANNTSRKSKRLWTEKKGGNLIRTCRLMSDTEEARYIAHNIMTGVSSGKKYADYCVLYRTHSQSRSIETALKGASIPYRVFGGQQFYKRKEIQDLIAYLNVSVNPNDYIRLSRIINEPKRGIGDTTLERVAALAEQYGLSFFDLLCEADRYDELKRSAEKLTGFADLIKDFNEKSRTMKLSDFYNYVLDKSGYDAMLDGLEKSERMMRRENLNELYNTVVKYEQDSEKNGNAPSLLGFLEETALISAVDDLDENADACVLMTMHCAKGLEFDTVFIAGFEEGLFPSAMSVGEEGGIEEERRLCYVAITRAKTQLFILNAKQRMAFGSIHPAVPSRFMDEIPKELLDEHNRCTTVSGQAKAAGLPRNAPVIHKDFVTTTVTPQKTVKTDTKNYEAGMRVRHKIFGEGKIVNVTKMSSDSMIEVVFDKVGNKKLMANYAGLEIL